MKFTGYKGLAQGSVLRPFLYNFVPCCILHSSHHLLQIACTLVAASLLGLTISFAKSKVILFFQKHLQPLVSICIGGRQLS
jgi:hypothetical protein